MKLNQGLVAIEHGSLILGQLHRTKIAVINRVRRTGKLRYANWKSASTKNALNLILKQYCPVFYVYQRNYEWYLVGPELTKKFNDDGVVTFNF